VPLLEHTEFEVPAAGRLGQWLAAPLPAALVLIAAVALALAFRVPHTTAYVEACRKAAAPLYPGEVKLISSNITDGAARIKLHIQQADARELVVVCDGASGSILRTLRIDEK
jgi:hypothetical protein